MTDIQLVPLLVHQGEFTAVDRAWEVHGVASLCRLRHLVSFHWVS